MGNQRGASAEADVRALKLSQLCLFIRHLLLGCAAVGVFGATAQAQLVPNQALPQGATVQAGGISLERPAGNQAGQLIIHQSTPKAVIEWNSFNVGKNASVEFKQPNASSATLNRIVSTTPSAIDGKITANGQVFLINPNGVIFSPTAQVDVGALVAGAAHLSNEDFLAGRFEFSNKDGKGRVLNQGRLSAAPGGFVALLAPEVVNQGVVLARRGTVSLLSGELITLTLNEEGKGLAGIAVTPAKYKTWVENKHVVEAQEGYVLLAAQSLKTLFEGVVKNDGAIEAGSVRQSVRGGAVSFESSALVENTGDISVASRHGNGGRISIASDVIDLKKGTLSATGAQEGDRKSVV